MESFLSEDFTEKIEEVHIDHKTTYIRQVTRLGRCQSLDLLVYEMRHNSVNDARVGLSKEAFWPTNGKDGLWCCLSPRITMPTIVFR